MVSGDSVVVLLAVRRGRYPGVTDGQRRSHIHFALLISDEFSDSDTTMSV